MFAARTIIGNYCFKKSINYILGKINWMTAKNMINWSIVKAIHKILHNQGPSNLAKYYKVNKRSSANISVVNFPKTKTSRNFYMYKGLQLYNKLPMEYKKLKPETFKIKGLKYFKSNLQVH